MNPLFLQNDSLFSLSVVVPNFNDAKYLRQCIESVVTQEVPPDEFIILDDASTDNSIEVISKAIAGYPFARIEHNPVNLGLGGVPTANKGLGLAKSKYVYFLGANDFILPGLFKKMKEGLERYPQAGVLSGMVWLVNQGGQFMKIHRSPVLSLQDRFFPAGVCRKMMIQNGSWLTGQTLVYRREALIEAGGFRESLKGLCDLLAAQVVVSRYGAVFSPSPLGVMRIHEGALLVNTLADAKLLEHILDEVEHSGSALEPKLFNSEMIRRTRLRLYFASLRLSQGATLDHILLRVGTIRRYALKVATKFPRALHTGLYFLIMRPSDAITSFWYRGLGGVYIELQQRIAGQIPPVYSGSK